MSSVIWDLQRALFDALSTAPAITALIGSGRIYDAVPHSHSFPILTIGDIQANDWSTSTETGFDCSVTLHSWLEGTSRKQTHELIDAIRNELDDANLLLIDSTLIFIRYLSSAVIPEQEQNLTHGTVRFRALLELP